MAGLDRSLPAATAIAVAKAGERRNAGRKTAGTRRIPVHSKNTAAARKVLQVKTETFRILLKTCHNKELCASVFEQTAAPTYYM